VRLLGILGLIGIAIAIVCALGLIINRLQGIQTLEPWNVPMLYVGAVSGFLGVSLFALGVTFNYLVSLFHKKPVRQGLFGRPIFKESIDRHFGWIGLLTLLAGLSIAFVALIWGFNGWPMDRFWLYGLGSAMLVLTGAQLIIYWVLLRVLDELSQREATVALELGSENSGETVLATAQVSLGTG
jgi:hypothetical protein